MQRWLLVATVLLLAGCAGPVATEDVPTAVRPPALSFHDCDGIEGMFPVPIEDIEAILPPGLHALPLAETPAKSLGAYFVSGLECATTSGALTLGPTGFFWVGVAVVPEDAALAEGKEFTGLLLGSVHTRAETADVFSAWTQGQVEMGSVALTWTGTPTDAAVGRLTGKGGSVSLVLESRVAERQDTMDELPARFFAYDGDRMVGAMDLSARDHQSISGQADLTLEGDLFGWAPPAGRTGVGFRAPIREMAFEWVDVVSMR